MILDQSLVLFDNTAITATVASNIIDLRATGNATLATGSYGVGAGTPVYLVVGTPTGYTAGATIDFVVRTSDSLSSGALSSPTTLYDSGTLTASATVLATGTYQFAVILPVSGVKQYLDINATVGGTSITAGNTNAYLTDAVPSLNIPLYSINSGVSVV